MELIILIIFIVMLFAGLSGSDIIFFKWFSNKRYDRKQKKIKKRSEINSNE